MAQHGAAKKEIERDEYWGSNSLDSRVPLTLGQGGWGPEARRPRRPSKPRTQLGQSTKTKIIRDTHWRDQAKVIE